MKKIIFSVIILNLLFSQVLTDNTFNNVQWISLSGAVISNPNDNFNPANLLETKETTILIGKTLYYEQDFLEFEYYSLRKNNFSLTLQELGTNTKKSITNLLTEKAIMFSHGITLLKDRNSTLRIGYNLNYFFIKQGASAGKSGDGSDGIAGKKRESVGFDVGLYAALRGKITFGAFVKNINSPKLGRGSNAQYLPRHLKIGFSYLPSSQLITTFNYERLLGSDLNQFRVLDLTGNNSNRLAAFNIQTISGYHPAKLENYDKILKIINNKGYYPYGLLQALNVKYIIHNQIGNISNFSKLDSKFLYRYYGNRLNPDEYVESYIYENNNFLERLFFVELLQKSINWVTLHSQEPAVRYI